jgi:hypothetical protein
MSSFRITVIRTQIKSFEGRFKFSGTAFLLLLVLKTFYECKYYHTACYKTCCWNNNFAALRLLCRNFSRNLKGKRPLEKLRRRWEYNIKMDLKAIRCEGTVWVHVLQNRV